MNYLQTRRCKLKKSLQIGAPVFGFYWTILTFVVVSKWLFTMIFQASPRVERGVCDSWRRLKFKLV